MAPQTDRPFARSPQAPIDGSRDALDLCILLDTTSALGDRIDEACEAIHGALAELQTLVRRPRASLVLYKDHRDALASYDVQHHPLTQSLFRLRAALRSDEAALGEGGHPRAQALECALHAANEQRWRAKARKAVILIGGSPPHGAGRSPFTSCCHQRDYRDEVEALARSQVRLYTAAADESIETQRVYEWMAAETRGAPLSWERPGDLQAAILAVIHRECGEIGRYSRKVRSSGRLSRSVAATLEALAAA